MKNWECIQFDTETTGRSAQLCQLLCAQFGHDGIQIVVDCQTISILNYKKLLESKLIIGQNLKFDLQFLYNYEIIPRHIYDTMIVEQLLYLGYPIAGQPGGISYSLKAIADRRLGIDIDKSTRGEIIWRGLDTKVIQYAAGDVEFLEQIKDSQAEDLKSKNCEVGADLENAFVPVVAYMEWCGIKLDENKWKAKMQKDQQNLEMSLQALNDFVVNNPVLSKFTEVNLQGDLFSGFDSAPKCTINWASSQQVIQVAKILGFNTSVQDKKTGEDKDSVLEKTLSLQKGVNDEFLRLYFGEGKEGDDNYYPGYTGSAKVVSSFGQGHLDAINPITGRIHTTFKQIGASSGRMSCGSSQSNTDLATYKHLAANRCKYPNIQQLPHDEVTRSCFVAEPGNSWVSCDWSAAEARLSGDIYNDQAIKDIFLKGIDSHSMYAKIFFKEELKDIDVQDIKKKRPDLRQKAKGPEFALNFGGGVFAIKQAIQCSEEEAQQIVKNYEEGFKGTAEFAKKGSAFLQTHGYIVINPITGHKIYWWDFDKWKHIQDQYNSKDWDWNDYKMYHKGTGDKVEQEVKQHFKAISKWNRMVRNSPTQGTCAIMLKDSQIEMFNWIVNHGYFGKIKLCALVHDEANWEYPETLTEFPKLLEQTMESSAAKYCKSLPIPASAEIGKYWKH